MSPGDVSGDDRTDDGTKCDDNYVGQRDGDSECAEEALSCDYSCTKMEITDIRVYWKGQDEVE